MIKIKIFILYIFVNYCKVKFINKEKEKKRIKIKHTNKTNKQLKKIKTKQHKN